MGKRLADKQLVKDDNGESDTESYEQRSAPAEVLRKRKIIMPRGQRATMAAPKSAAPSVVDAKLKALNTQFIKAIKLAESPDSIADYRLAAEKYLAYYKQVTALAGAEPAREKEPELAPANPFGKLGDSKPAFAFSSQTSTGDKFSFTTNSSNASDVFGKEQKSPFAFAPKKDTDPAFDSPKPTANDKPAFSFGKTEKPVSFLEAKPSTFDSTSKDTPKPTFLFASKPESEAKPFSFGSNAEAGKPLFGAESDDAPKPVFLFGSKPGSENKPAFSFGAQPQSGEKERDTVSEEPKDKPAFSFGKSEATSSLFGSNTQEKSAFSFGSKPENEKPAFSFASKPDAEKPAFSFASKPDAEKPAFSFGSKSNTEKPSTSLGTEPDSEKPVLSFGGKENSEKSAFSFGKPQGEKTTLSFGTTEKPAFSFNKSGDKTSDESSEKPAFSFGSSPNPFAKAGAVTFGAKSDGQQKPSPFTFSSEAKSVPFGSLQPSFAPTNVDSKSEEANDEEVKNDEEDGVTIGQGVTGEEDEDVIYHKRAKLMSVDIKNTENPYTNIGVGELKVLFSKETKKTRVVIRADGGLRVLLNLALLSNASYTSKGNGSLVQFPCASDGGELQTYMIKVKTPKDGEELLEVLKKQAP